MKLKIAAFIYDVIEEKDPMGENGQPIDGQIRTTDGIIRIRDVTSKQFKQQVILHEAVHGICYQYGMRQLSEKDTDVMATAIMCFIKDNPEFIKEIIEAGGSTKKHGKQE